MLFWGLAAVVLILDQASKWLISTNMEPFETVPLIPGVFHLTYTRNPGAAFGIFPNQTIFFVLVTLVVVLVIIVVNRRLKGHFLLRLALALQLGGALGNLLDRLRLGYVVDMLDFRFWPVFNTADSAIVIGVILLGLEIWRTPDPERKKAESES